MDQEKLTPELEKLISKVKLKEPAPKIMANYLSEVNAKIDQGVGGPHFGFPQVTVFFVIGAALAGFLYFFLVHPQVQPAFEIKNASVKEDGIDQSRQMASLIPPRIQSTAGTSTQKSLTLEEEIAVLEASDESADVFGDDEALDELTVLDEVELSPGLGNQTPGI